MFLCDNTQTEKVWEKNLRLRVPNPLCKMWNGYRELLLKCEELETVANIQIKYL